MKNRRRAASRTRPPRKPHEAPAAASGGGDDGKKPPTPPRAGDPQPDPESTGGEKSTPSARNEPDGGKPAAGEKSTPTARSTPAGENEATTPQTARNAHAPDPDPAATTEENTAPTAVVPASEAPTVELTPAGEAPASESRPLSVDPAKMSPTLRAVVDFLSKAPLEHNAHQRTPEELRYLARLADALGMNDALSGRPDPLASLQELAEMARARGFFGDPDTGATPRSMRDPEDFGPLSLDERYGGEEYWRNEVDPDVLRAQEAEFRKLGLDDRLNRAAAEEAAAARPALEGNTSRTPDEHAGLPLEPWSDPTYGPGDPPRALTLDELRADIAERLGLSDEQIAPDRLPETAGELQYRNMLRAGAIEALDEASARHDAATDPVQRTQLAKIRDEWARLLRVDPDLLAPELRDATLTALRDETVRRAADIADLMAATFHTPDPSGPQHLVLEANGERVHVTVRTDENGVKHLEPAERPPLPKDRLPAKPDPVLLPFGKRLWNFIRSGFSDQYPKYASGSGLDGTGQKQIIHEIGGWLHNDFLHELDINPSRLAKEFATFWKAREYLPLVNRLTGKIANVVSEWVPRRTRDGGEYQPWLTEVDPATRAKVAAELAAAGISNEDPPTGQHQPALPPGEDPAAVTQRPALPELTSGEHPAEAAGGQPDPHSTPPSDPAAERAGLPKTLADQLDVRDDALREVLKQAARQGIDLRTAEPATLRLLVDEAKYVMMRRAGAVEALADAARSYNLQDGLVPYSREMNFFDKDPLGRYLRELVHSDPTRKEWALTKLARKFGLVGKDDPLVTMLEWESKPNGGDPARHFDSLSPEEMSTRKEGILFDRALRRDQIREERSNWAQMLGLGLDELTPERLPHTLAELRMAVREHADQVVDLGHAVDDYVHADDQVRTAAESIAADVGRAWVQEHDGATLGDSVSILGGEPPRLTVIRGSTDHARVLADFLAEHPEIGHQLADGRIATGLPHGLPG